MSAGRRALRRENLFTALLTLAPKASYPLYTRPFTEALVLIEGEAAVDVEDRRYRLRALDAITISPQIPRRVVNLSANRPAVLHVAMAAATPDQTWVNGRFAATTSRPAQPAARGPSGSAAMTLRARFELAPSALFQDSTMPSSARRASVAAMVSSSPARGSLAIAMSSTSRSPSSRGRQPASSKDAVTSLRATRRRSCPRAAAITSST